MALKELVIKMLEKAIKDLKADNSELSESEAMDIMSVMCHHAMSKATACKYLNISRSRFDVLVRSKKLPKGRKRVGFKELVWYKDEIDNCINKKNKSKIYDNH